jgi:hypothetical protein
VEAVNDFVREQGLTLLAMTQENWPTFMIARDMTHEQARAMKLRMQFNLPMLVDIADYPHSGHFELKVSAFDKGRVSTVLSFRNSPPPETP